MSRGRLLLPLVALLLAATGPMVSSAQDGGPMPVTLPTGRSFEGHVEAALVRSSQSLQFDSWTARLYNVTVWRITANATGTSLFSHSTIPSGTETDREKVPTFYPELEVTVTGQSRSGHVGIHGDPDTVASFVGAGPCELESRSQTLLSIGNPLWQGDRNDADDLQFYRNVTRPHVLATCSGDLRIDGRALVQVFGLELRLREPDGTERTFTTGSQKRVTATIKESQGEWLNFDAQRVVLESRSPMRWRVALLDVSTEGAHVTPDRLVLLPLGAVAPAPGPLEGALAAPLRGIAWFLAVGAVAGGAVLVKRARERSRLRSAVEDVEEAWDAEDCMSRADVHIQSERFDRALEWAQQARRLAPTSYTVRATEGFLLGRLGRVDEALEAYLEASRLAPEDGGPDLEAARLAMDGGKPHGVVEEWVERALAKNPLLVPEVDEQEEFRVLAGSPRFERAVAAAWDAYADRSGLGGP